MANHRLEAMPIRTCVVYRVCQHWRAPIFARLASLPDIDLTVLHGESIPGTKLTNGANLVGFKHVEMKTWKIRVRSSGRDSIAVFSPSVLRALHRAKPDVIVTEGGSNILTNLLVFAYAIVMRVPVVWWTLGMLPNRRFTGLGRVYRLIVTRMERRAAALLGYSSVALEYFKRMNYAAERCFRAVNCVDTDQVISRLPFDEKASGAIAARFGIEGRFVVLFVGALTSAKRIDRLLRAFASVRRSNEKPFLLIVGDGPERRALLDLAHALGIEKDVHFTGEVVDDVGAYYEVADVFVLPGLGGLAVSEAMAHSLPVICGIGDGCEVDLVQPGTGYRFDSDNDDAAEAFIANALFKLAGDSRLTASLGKAARRVIDTQYNAGTYVAGIRQAIRHAWVAGRLTQSK